MAVAGTPGLLAADQVVRTDVAERDQRGVVERQVELLAPAGVAPRIERRLIAATEWIAVMVSTMAMAWRSPSPLASPLTLIMPVSACSTGS